MNIPEEINRLLAQQKRDDLDQLGRVHTQQAKEEATMTEPDFEQIAARRKAPFVIMWFVFVVVVGLVGVVSILMAGVKP